MENEKQIETVVNSAALKTHMEMHHNSLWLDMSLALPKTGFATGVVISLVCN